LQVQHCFSLISSKCSFSASKHFRHLTSCVLMLYHAVAQDSLPQIEHGPLALNRLFIMLRTFTHWPL